MKARTAWLLRNGLTAALLAGAWNTIPARPLRVLVVLIHEIFHALASLASGGAVLRIEVLSYSSGVTTLTGGSPLAVYSAGYLGTALLGSLLLAAGPLVRVKRFLYLGVGLLVLGGTLLAVRNPFGWAYGLAVGALLLVLFFREFRFSSWLTDLLGVLCLVDVFRDLAAFWLSPSQNDASILSQSSGLPYAGVLGAWAILTLSMVAAAWCVARRNLEPGYQERRPEWGEFSFRKGEKMEGESEGARGRITLIVYFSLLGAVVLLMAWSARFVLFQPWTAREWVGAAASGDAIYLFGGRDRAGENYAEIYRLQPVRRSIRRVGSLPSPRFGMGVAALGQRIYVLGGFDGRKVYDEVLALDTRTGRLSQAGRLPGPRAFGSAAAAGEALYYAGGWDGQRQLDEVVRLRPGGPDGSLEAVLAGRLPSPREFAAAALYHDRLYVLGGSDDRGGYLDEIVELDPGQPTLTGRLVGRLPSSRIRSAVFATPEAIYLLGGWEGRRVDQVLAFRAAGPGAQATGFEARELPPLPRPLADIVAVGVGGAVYLVGGTHERFQRQVGLLRWDPATGLAQSLKLRNFLFW